VSSKDLRCGRVFRKKRKVHGVLALPPSGDRSLCPTPLLTNILPQCVQTCVRLLTLSCKRSFHLVSDIPVAIPGFCKPSKWNWEGLDVSFLTNCIDKLIEFAQPADMLILKTHHSDINNSRHCCCIRNRLLCCPSDGIWRPLSRKAFDDLFILRSIIGFERCSACEPYQRCAKLRL